MSSRRVPLVFGPVDHKPCRATPDLSLMRKRQAFFVLMYPKVPRSLEIYIEMQWLIVYTFVYLNPEDIGWLINNRANIEDILPVFGLGFVFDVWKRLHHMWV